jgi:hypothetical protein
LFIKGAHVTLPVLLGLSFLASGLGHAFFNPTTEVFIGVLELVGSAALFAGALLIYRRYTAPALICYGMAVACIVIALVLHIGRLIGQFSK